MLSQDQIDFFHANGYLIMRGVVRGKEMEQLQQAADEVQAQGIARIDAESHRYAMGPHGDEVYWRSEEMWERGDVWRAVAVNPDLLENIGQCVGQPFFPWNDSLVVKLPHSGATVKWHQDPPYNDPARKSTYPVPNFTTDLYLDHSGPDNGCVYAIPGRHLEGHLELDGFDIDRLIRDGVAVPLEMEAGDALFHCLSTPHGSAPNLSTAQRRVFYMHYVADEVYRDGYGSAPWAAQKPGWGPERRRIVESMLESRRVLGFEAPLERADIRFGEGGFGFTGSPSTPPRYWELHTQNRQDAVGGATVA